MANIGRPPCDEGVVRTSRASGPCTPASAPWVLAATIIGSAMACIDGTILGASSATGETRSHLINSAQVIQEAALPHRIGLKKARNRYLWSFAKRRILFRKHL